ncbi:MAG: hypothetical protein ACRC80_31425 [Waterburya sp.]
MCDSFLGDPIERSRLRRVGKNRKDNKAFQEKMIAHQNITLQLSGIYLLKFILDLNA